MIINILKISGAGIISILLAEILHLDFSIHAGVVAILSIQPTKKETLKTAISRTIAYIVALIIAAISFHTMGFTISAFLVYLFFFVSICMIYGWQASITTNSVIVSHFLTYGNMSAHALINETAIFAIGVLSGVILNLHLKKDVDYIEELKTQADNQIKKILRSMAKHILVEDKSDYGYHHFKKLQHIIAEAEHTAALNYENQFRTDDTYDMKYIAMRMDQQNTLLEMYKLVRQLQTTPDSAKRISQFLKRIATEYQQDNPADTLLEAFYDLENDLQETDLPKERKEFEDRALLYVLLRKMEEFLLIKATFMLEQ